jgi:class 3 adenylate cyclase
MFTDLVGSTALTGALDPEEMREVLRIYQNTVTGEVTRLEGHVAQLMGDGVVAYFGWPRAHEDGAERAVRAGLAVTSAVARLQAPNGTMLACRVGIATGLVVVGDLIGERLLPENAAVGETPNLAARLQALAGPGHVLVAEGTRRLAGDAFAFIALPDQIVKGVGEPIAVFRVGGEVKTRSRFEARSGSAPLPMVGRDQELALLIERWAAAKTGEGQTVLLVGEPGIGKSRISQALADALSSEPHVRIDYQCSPYHVDSAFWPAIQQLERVGKAVNLIGQRKGGHHARHG